MAMTEADAWASLWRATARAYAWIEVRAWEDPRPEFHVQFRNNVRFSGFDKKDVYRRAATYRDTVKALTGELP